jgi:hypothetical protein
MNALREYPRYLTEAELSMLFFILPEDIPVYYKYRERITNMLLIGEGRFGEWNYILGFENDQPDLSYASLPVFASGQVILDSASVQVTLHEEYDNKIEFSINNLSGDVVPASGKITGGWTYSTWIPGEPSPFKNDELREVQISPVKNGLVLAISKVNRSIWLYEDENKYKHIIPVTNFINELLRGNTTIDRTKGINMNHIFGNLSLFSDNDFKKAMINYNKQWRKLDLSKVESTAGEKKSGLFSRIFRKN